MRLKLTYKKILVFAVAVNPTLCLFMLSHPNPQLLEEAAVAPSEKETKREEAVTVSLSKTYATLIDHTCQSGLPHNSKHRCY